MKDLQTEFSSLQVITATAVSTNLIDLGAPKTAPGAPAAQKRDLGGGNNIPISIQVIAAFATLTSLTVNIQMATDAAFTSPVVVASTGPIAAAALTAKAKLPISMLPQGADLRFMRLQYVVAGSNATAGSITAGLVFGDYAHG